MSDTEKSGIDPDEIRRQWVRRHRERKNQPPPTPLTPETPAVSPSTKEYGTFGTGNRPGKVISQPPGK